MNKEIMEGAGFSKEVKKVEIFICPLCNKEIGSFRDAISVREYQISGLCQECQDKFFTEKEG